MKLNWFLSQCLFLWIGNEVKLTHASKYIQSNDASEEVAYSRNKYKVDSQIFRGVESYAGFIPINQEYDSNIFFWYFPAPNAVQDTPWIIWLQGGPGISSLAGIFEINGPFIIKDDEVHLRNTSWANDYSVLYIDNPVGAGFSYTCNDKGYTTREDEVGEHLLEFLRRFLDVFPELRTPPLFVAGESYAGKYVPTLSWYLHRHKYEAEYHVNLKGLLIGNGLVDPRSMMHYSELVQVLGILDDEESEELRKAEADAVKLLDAGKMVDAANVRICLAEILESMVDVEINLSTDMSPPKLLKGEGVKRIFNGLLENAEGADKARLLAESKPEAGAWLHALPSPHKFNETIEYIKKHSSINIMNFNEDGPLKFSFLDFLERPDVRDALHVGDATFDVDNQLVYANMLPDIMNTTKPLVEELLQHYGVLCYSGQLDVIVPYAGSKHLYSSLQWSGRENYQSAVRESMKLDATGPVVGYRKSGGKFTDVVIRKAGHMAARDQPDAVLLMLSDFIEEHSSTDI